MSLTEIKTKRMPTEGRAAARIPQFVPSRPKDVGRRETPNEYLARLLAKAKLMQKVPSA